MHVLMSMVQEDTGVRLFQTLMIAPFKEPGGTVDLIRYG